MPFLKSVKRNLWGVSVMEDILFTEKNHLGLVTLNRPQALNALTRPMLFALFEQLMAWQVDDNIHAVVIMALDGRAFCAGGDVRFIYQLGRANHAEQMAFFETEYRLNYLIHTFKKPYIALMNGITMGGGVGISLHGTYPVASEHFSFAMPETGIGFYPDIGSSYWLTRCPGHLGVYLGLTGARLNRFEALEAGLVRHCIDSEHFQAVLNQLMATDLSADAHAGVANVLSAFSEKPQPIKKMDGIETCFQYNKIESIIDALQRVDDEWHRNTLSALLKKAPLSLKVTLHQLKSAHSMTIGDCLSMDYGLTHHFLKDSDFYEGVRALLVDKDNAPIWQPSTLADVTHAKVLSYFKPLKTEPLFE